MNLSSRYESTEFRALLHGIVRAIDAVYGTESYLLIGAAT